MIKRVPGRIITFIDNVVANRYNGDKAQPPFLFLRAEVHEGLIYALRERVHIAHDCNGLLVGLSPEGAQITYRSRPRRCVERFELADLTGEGVGRNDARTDYFMYASDMRISFASFNDMHAALRAEVVDVVRNIVDTFEPPILVGIND